MKSGEILRQFFATPEVAALVGARYRRQLLSRLFGAAAILAVAIILSFSLSLSPGGFVACLTVALLVAILSLRLFELVHRPRAAVGVVDTIRHEYYQKHAKGTGGWERWYTAQIHTEDMVITLRGEDGALLSREIVLPARYARAIRLGDTLLAHPALPYPANLTSDTVCLCMQCGTMQGTNRTHCLSCGLLLCHRDTVV